MKLFLFPEIRTQDGLSEEEVEFVVDKRDDDVTESDDQNLAKEASSGFRSDVASLEEFPENGVFSEKVKIFKIWRQNSNRFIQH